MLYKLKLWEIRAIIKGYRNRCHTIWEATRWQTFCILCALGNKKLNTVTDLMKFPWERDWSNLPTEDEVEELQQKIRNINMQQEDGNS